MSLSKLLVSPSRPGCSCTGDPRAEVAWLTAMEKRCTTKHRSSAIKMACSQGQGIEQHQHGLLDARRSTRPLGKDGVCSLANGLFAANHGRDGLVVLLAIEVWSLALLASILSSGPGHSPCIGFVSSSTRSTAPLLHSREDKQDAKEKRLNVVLTC